MHEENQALEAQNQSLQALVTELLITNQKLRVELAHLRQRTPTAKAIHPPQPQDHSAA